MQATIALPICILCVLIISFVYYKYIITICVSRRRPIIHVTDLNNVNITPLPPSYEDVANDLPPEYTETENRLTNRHLSLRYDNL